MDSQERFTGTKGTKKWVYGYKAHIVADANHDLPVGIITTTGSGSETRMLPKLVRHTLDLYPWMQPETLIADRGYDSKANNEWVFNQGIEPIIKKTRYDQGGNRVGRHLHPGRHPHLHGRSANGICLLRR